MNTTNKTHGSHGIELLDTDLETVAGGFTNGVLADAKAVSGPPPASWLSVAKRPPNKGPGTAVQGTAANATNQVAANAAAAVQNIFS